MRAGMFLWLVLGLTVVTGCSTSTPAPPPPKTAPKPPPSSAKPAKPAWQMRKVVPDAVTVPGGRLHTVKPGETGLAIAAAYGVSWSQIVATNKLKPPYVLEVGQKLMLPSAKQVAQMSIEDRAKAFDLNIDDIITGTAPAAPAPKLTPKPGTAPKPLPPPAATGPAPPFGWPVDGRILSGFGPKPGGRFNDGVNLKASQGAAVRSAGDGTVAYAGDAIPGFGNLILITHANGYVTAYGHNEALLVARGKKVGRGEVIARAGATGAVTEPQVHFEIRKNRVPVDPVKVIGGR